MAQGKKLSQKQMTEIANMYIQGMTYEQIGKAIGCSKMCIWNNVKNNPEQQAIIKDMRERYADELCDLAVDCMKEVLLNSDQIPKTVLVQYLGIAMKYSGLATNQNVNVKDEKKISLKDFSLDELANLRF